MKNKDGVLPRVLIDLENKRLVVRSPVLGRFILNFGKMYDLMKGDKHGETSTKAVTEKTTVITSERSDRSKS
jgi:hypothetical protein